MIEVQQLTKYAISNSRPPSTWLSEWSVLDGERVAGADIPADYTECDQATYEATLAAQAAAQSASADQAIYDYRMQLAEKRRQLVAAGLTVEVARILVPDPYNDYSIDG